MESILKAIKKKKIPINPAIVISNKHDAKGLKIAEKLGVKIEVVESKGFKGSRAEYDKKIITILTKYGVTPKNGLVCLAGFIRIINIHPALLPAFPGLDSQKQAIEYGAKYSGCSVHFVDTGMDTGPVIIQAVVKVNEKDTEETLSKKILKEEHRIYPEAVNLFARKKIKVSGRRTVIS
jgi:phosphoribosylglycinamide formyltransferase 1